ncbi:T9SS type B sorting domain-containing protein [Algibacter sp.]|nr:T9SS type B sorting domain-containing protein [Algibacter sp.]MDA9775231.1 T9SS type B sorting domain-containing protein [Algibacter sp.]
MLILFAINVSNCQQESANWYFGNNAGLNFSNGLVTPLLDGKLRTNEGCATISNNNGELLFYTDGIRVWDRNHNVMPNGNGLLGNPSSTQSAIIVPKPNSNSVFYIFTVSAGGDNDGLRYSEVNLDLNNGDGDISSLKNKLLVTPSSEKISAVQHANGKDFWVIAHGWNNSNLLAYKVSELGVDLNPIISTLGAFHGGESKNTIGYMKISPNGKKIALAKWHIDSFVELFDFDSRTGNVYNAILLDNVFESTPDSGAYGIEFSPDSRLLYVSNLNLKIFSSSLHQFDLSSYNKPDIINSNTILYNGRDVLSGIQLALDGRIYISNSLSSSLDFIDNPNIKGVDCNYTNKGLNLNGRSTVFGLPPFIQSFFVGSIETHDVCMGTLSDFSIDTQEPIDEVLWDFGDGITSTELSPEHLFTTYGVYEVKAEIKSGYNTYYLSKTIMIYETPIIDVKKNWAICSGVSRTLFLDSTHDAYLWSTSESTSTITVSTPGTYTVTVYKNQPNELGVCVASEELVVIGSGLPEYIDIKLQDWTLNSNSVTINTNGLGDYEYSIDGINFQESNMFTDLTFGEYRVYIKDKNGCGIIDKEVYLLNYPRYFTPNGDGYHDYWKIYFSEIEPDMTVHIFDRYGKFIKQISPSSIGWDGTYNGNKLVSSDYWFLVNRPSKGKQYRGHFSLKR